MPNPKPSVGDIWYQSRYKTYYLITKVVDRDPSSFNMDMAYVLYLTGEDDYAKGVISDTVSKMQRDEFGWQFIS